MDAAGEAAFLSKSHDAAKSLWPGVVMINGAPYQVALTREPVSVQVEEGDQPGVRTVRGLLVELSKADHPAEPAVDWAVKDQASGLVYKIFSVAGQDPSDPEWYLKCGLFK